MMEVTEGLSAAQRDGMEAMEAKVTEGFPAPMSVMKNSVGTLVLAWVIQGFRVRVWISPDGRIESDVSTTHPGGGAPIHLLAGLVAFNAQLQQLFAVQRNALPE